VVPLAGVRVLWLSPSSPLVKVAALVEVAGSAASLARLLIRTRHVDPQIVSALVEYPIDVPAVLGHGRWAPHTPRPVELPLAVHRRTLITVEDSFGGLDRMRRASMMGLGLSGGLRGDRTATLLVPTLRLSPGAVLAVNALRVLLEFAETPDTYSHLWPGSEDRTRSAVDDVHGQVDADSLRTGAAA
jgi:hypothetical protein